MTLPATWFPMTPAGRAARYNLVWATKYPDSRLYCESGTAIHGVWSPGNDYRNRSSMYGAYPRGYLERIFCLFPDAGRILHLFSGSLTAEQVCGAWPVKHLEGPAQLRFDDGLHPAARAAQPEMIGDAESLSLIFGNPASHLKFDLILADPPYDRYGTRGAGSPGLRAGRGSDSLSRSFRRSQPWDATGDFVRTRRAASGAGEGVGRRRARR